MVFHRRSGKQRLLNGWSRFGALIANRVSNVVSFCRSPLLPAATIAPHVRPPLTGAPSARARSQPTKTKNAATVQFKRLYEPCARTQRSFVPRLRSCVRGYLGSLHRTPRRFSNGGTPADVSSVPGWSTRRWTRRCPERCAHGTQRYTVARTSRSLFTSPRASAGAFRRRAWDSPYLWRLS